MAQRNRSAEIKAGVVVLIALLMLALGIFLVSGGFDLFVPKRTITILFEDSGGVASGAAVHVAGRKRGEVLGLEDIEAKGRDGVTRIYVAVEVEIDRAARVHKDSRIWVSKTITGIITLNIDYGPSREPADPEAYLFGRRLATFDEVIDDGKQLLESAKSIVVDLEHSIGRIDVMLTGLDVEQMEARVVEILDRALGSAAELELILKENREPIRGMIGRAGDTVGDAKALMESARGSWERLDPKVQSTVEEARGVLQDLRLVLAENRENMKRVVQNLVDASARIAPVLDQVELLSAEAYGTVAEIRPHLVSLFRTARGAATNLNAVTEDLKTSPWKLARKPSDRESDEVHLFNAARLYVVAAEKVRTQIDDLATLSRLGVLENEEQAELITQVLARLRKSLQEYDKQEQQLQRLMAENAPK